MNPPPAPRRDLDVLDIDEAEERAYRWLLAHPGSTAQELAQALPMSSRRVQRLLDGIEGKGLVTWSPQRPRRYVAASPALAMEALVLKRLEQLQRARGVIQELQEQAAQREDEEQLVELITSREATSQAYEHLQRTAQDEVLGLIRLPVLVTRIDVPPEQSQRTQRDTQARGVRYRSIVDGEFLATPGIAERVLVDVVAGEEIRVVPSLPFKMVLVDRRVAFIPLDLDRADSPSLLVRSVALVNALHALFELLWERAAPMDPGVGPEGAGQGGDQPESLQQVLALLAAGLADKVVARELDISGSTLNRRIVELMATLGAQTRFQLGWMAARQAMQDGARGTR
jgi:predicted transcriptional regulator